MMKKKKKVISAVLTAALGVTAAFPAAVFAAEGDGAENAGGGAPEAKIKHVKYLNGFEDGTIRPSQQLTRAQAAQMIYSVAGGAQLKDEELNPQAVSKPDESDSSVISGADESGSQVVLKTNESGSQAVSETDERVMKSRVKFSDVSENAWYYPAVTVMASEGVFKGYEDGTFRPDKKITRAEFAAILSAYYDMRQVDILSDESSRADADNRDRASKVHSMFADVSSESWYFDAVESAAKNGWVTGYSDGRFQPLSDTTRAEAVTMINRMLGRKADRFTMNLSSDLRIMPDVTSYHWAYYELAEALTEHICTVSEQGETWISHEPGTVELSSGWHNIDGELFHVNSSSLFDYKTSVDGLQLDVHGRYTTGDAELDAMLTEAAKEALDSGMTQEQRLRAMYDYAKETFSYRGAQNVETGSTGWEPEIAKTMLTSKKGNCYSWAAAFTYLARKVGYPATAIAGESVSAKGNRSVHAWTEITKDGVAYTFDPEIEAVYAANYGENYDLYKKAYGTTPITYIKPEIEDPDDGNGGEEQPDEKLADILAMVYDGIDSPGTMQVPLNSQNEKYYLGVEGLDYRAGIGSDAMVNAVPHSVVLIEMNDGADIEAAKKSIKENADGRKWICVGVEDDDIRVENVGNYVLLVMSEGSEQYIDNFLKNADKIAVA